MRQFSAIESSDALLTAFFNIFSLSFLFGSHEGHILMYDSSIFGGGGRALSVIGIETSLSSGNVEVRQANWTI